jgi:hypothetical protein
MSHAMSSDVYKQPMHNPQLVVAGKNLGALLLALVVDLLDDLRVVLQNVGQPRLGQNLFPQVIGLQSFRAEGRPQPC